MYLLINNVQGYFTRDLVQQHGRIKSRNYILCYDVELYVDPLIY